MPRYRPLAKGWGGSLTTLHIISHGEPGTLYLGNSILNAETLQSRYRAAVQQWRHALSDNAHILIYGCNVAAPEKGRSIPCTKSSVGSKDFPGDAVAPTIFPCSAAPLLPLLRELTGADISASTTPTGNATLGGNWQLEVSTAKVRPALALQSEAMADYGSTLGVQLEWAKNLENNGSANVGSRIATDSSNNVLVSGSFQNNIDIDGDGIDDLTSNGDEDVYVAKLDSSGNLSWAKSFGSDSYTFGYEIATDSNGNVLVSGQFLGNIDIDGDGTNDLTHTTNNNVTLDAYFAKFDSSGNYLWAKGFGSTDSDLLIAIDSSGNVLVTGDFSGNIDIDGDGTDDLTSNDRSDAYLAKFDSSGNLSWAKNIGGSSLDRARSIATDNSGNVLVAGSFNENIDLDRNGTDDLTSNGGTSAFVAKFDSSGNLSWAKNSNNFGFGIATDTSNNVLVSGSFQNNIDIDGDGTDDLTSNGGTSAFMAKFDSSDNLSWAKNIGVSTYSVQDITTDSNGNVLAIGYFNGTDESTNNDLDIYVVKLDSNGNLNGAKSFGSTGYDFGVEIASDTNGNVLTAGWFDNSIDIDGDGFDDLVRSGSHYDSYIVKLFFNEPPTSTDTSIAFDEDSTYNFIASDFPFTDSDGGDTLQAVTITQLPTVGTFTLTGTAVSLNQVIPVADLPNLVFAPVADANGSNYDSFKFQVNDGSQDSASEYTLTLNVNAVNDPPTLSNISKSGNEDSDITFAAANFTAAFSDIDGDSLSQIKITSLPSNGTLKLNGTAVTAKQEIDAANLGNLTFTPDADFNGSTSFTWNGSDGQVYADADATVNLTVNAVNDAPTVSTVTKSGNQDTDIVFTASDFTAAFSDPDSDSLAAIKITSLPSNGTLQLSGTEVSVNQEIYVAEVGNLTFTADANFNGITSFTWNGSDGTTYADEDATNLLDIGAANNPPKVNFSNTPWHRRFINISNSWVFEWTFPEDAFTDPDPGQTLSYSASLDDGSPLPDWLTFDTNTRTFSGVFPQAQRFRIEVTATDPFGASASDTVLFSGSKYGVVIDGYIQGGTVFFDANFNGIQDANEPVTTSDANGFYDLDISLDSFDRNENGLIDNDEGNIVVIGGTDTATGLPLETPLTAPADGLVVTLLTSLVADLTNQGLSSDAANQQVVAALGLPEFVNVTTLDPIAATNNNEPGGLETLAAMTKVQNAVTQIAKLISGAAAGLDNNLIVRDVIEAIVSQIQTGASLDVSDSTQLAVLIENAATASQQSDPNLDLQHILSLAADAAGVMAAANQRIDNIVSSSGANLGQQIHSEIAKVQFVALSETSQDLQLAGADEKPITDVVAENTGAALEAQIQAAAAQLPNPPFGLSGVEAPAASPIAIAPADLTLPASSFANVNLELVLDSEETQVGTENNDTLTGNSGSDIFLGQQGDDLLEGRDGDDWMNGNRGSDTLSGGLGNDTLYGGKENDILNGDDGDDFAFGNWGSDILNGSDGNDFLSGNQENDTLNGGDGNDTLHGGKNEDNLFGNNGSDIIYGDRGNDLLSGEDGSDFLNGNQGEDTLTGGSGNDTLRGGKDNDSLNGGDGDDLLWGDMGSDLLFGGNGSDTFVLKAGSGSDNIADFANGSDSLALAGGLSFEQLTITASDGNTLIYSGNELLATLTGVDVNLIASEDFTVLA